MNCRGSSPLAMVLMLLLAGITLLHSNAGLLEQGMTGLSDEAQYLRDFYQAQSSLEQGLQEQWPEKAGWQCRKADISGGYSCLLWQSSDAGILLGQSSGFGKQLWRLVRRSTPESLQITAIHRGWTDLCPFREVAQCSVSLSGL